MICVASIVLVAGFIQSLTGFGFALVATPLLFLLIDPKMVIVLVVTLGSATMLVLAIVYRKDFNKKRIIYMSSGGIIGVPLGAYLLFVIPAVALKLIVATVIILLSILLFLNITYYFKQFITGHITAGFLSGLLGSSTSMGGPPSVLFLLSQKVQRNEFIATLAMTGIIHSTVILGTYCSMGMINLDILKIAGISLPAMAVGILLGTITVRKINSVLFKNIAIFTVMLSATASIITTLVFR